MYNHVVYHQLLLDKLIPTFIVKWPPGDRAVRWIKIQQDGPKAHIDNNDLEFLVMLL